MIARLGLGKDSNLMTVTHFETSLELQQSLQEISIARGCAAWLGQGLEFDDSYTL